MAPTDDVGTLHHNSLLALVWACFGTAFLFVSLRIVIRLKFTRKLTAEDYWTFFALAALLALCTLETIQLSSLYYMTGIQAGTIPISMSVMAESEEYLKFEFPIVVLYWTVLWSVKAGFLALYYRLFRELPIYRRIWYGLAAFTFLAYAGCWVSLSVSCGSLPNFFGFETCATDQDIWMSNFNIYFSTCADVVTDLCIMAMPLRLIYNVQVSAKQKLGLVCVFTLSFVMIAFSIIRANQVLVPASFVNLTLLMVWSTLAVSISVIVGSLPAFKLILTNRSATKRSRNGYSNGSHQRQTNNDNKPQSTFKAASVPLNSFSSTKSANKKRYAGSGMSTEDILKPGTAGSTVSGRTISGRTISGRTISGPILVRHDVEISRSPQSETSRPYPVYQSPRPQQPGF